MKSNWDCKKWLRVYGQGERLRREAITKNWPKGIFSEKRAQIHDVHILMHGCVDCNCKIHEKDQIIGCLNRWMSHNKVCGISELKRAIDFLNKLIETEHDKEEVR